MSTSPFRLKHPGGWFAAGWQVECALALLSDSTFKVFVWVCLNADRSRGSLKANSATIAPSVSQTEPEVVRGLEELIRKGVCLPMANDVLQLTERFWPYERFGYDRPSDISVYLEQVKRVFLDRRCVRSAFTAADEKLATQLHRKGVPVENVERAILLGSLRKYIAWVNNGGGTPITTLHYFKGLFEEVEQVQVSADYWRYVEHKVRLVEQRWPAHKSEVETKTK